LTRPRRALRKFACDAATEPPPAPVTIATAIEANRHRFLHPVLTDAGARCAQTLGHVAVGRTLLSGDGKQNSAV
jgi:hypothetical protein